MQVVKVGSKGQISIPKNILERLGIRKHTLMLVEVARTERSFRAQPACTHSRSTVRSG
jgi:AbrB family looped-hinge helix DNA binding protein